jgi:L,D-transpeptidase catalytic domain
MMSGFLNRGRRQARLRAGTLAVAALAALIVAGGHAFARNGTGERAVEAIESRAAGEPVMAIVSLQKQRITIYDASGWILRAPVSSGQKGRETPAGIFSVIQKEAEHYSNLYDDAYMPHMQRITWSGIALHGGALPGYPASHGCIRLPFEFAARLFDVTGLGLRVIVAPTDVAPMEIAHPALLHPKPGLEALAASRKAEADEAIRKSDQARLAAGAAYREAMQAMVPARTAENLKLRAEAQLAAAEAALGSATSAEAKQEAEDAKAAAAGRVAELQAKWEAARAELQPKLDARNATREAAVAAETARTAATEAVRQAEREREPVSVLISRKTQRLYVRQGFEPIFDAPVTIQDPDRPVGTHVFTAMERIDGGADMRWTVISLESGRQQSGTPEPRSGRRGGSVQEGEPMPTGLDGAKAALDRIVIPQEALDRIPGVAPRSTLIVTDEAVSAETGKGTDFVVLLSGEPQGGIKFRRRAPMVGFGFPRLPFGGPRFTGPFSSW